MLKPPSSVTFIHRAWVLLRNCSIALAFAAPVVGAQAQIVIGQTAGFSGSAAAGVKETTAGAQLWFDAVNAKGGIKGQPIKLVSVDDKFEPKLAAENARQLVKDPQVLALFLTRGTPHTEAILPVLAETGIALVGPSTGAKSLHDPVNKYVFNVRASYQREAEKAVEHLATLGIVRIAVVHADDSFGRDALEGAARGLKKAKLEPAAILKADRDKPDYGPLVGAVIKTQAQAVIWAGSSKAAAGGVKALRAGKSAVRVVTLSNNASTGFIKELGTDARGVIVTQVFPNERSIATPMVKQAMELAQAAGVKLSPAMLEGYAAAKVLVEAIKRAGPSPTREKIVTALNGMKSYDLGGLEVSYSSTDHTGLDFADLSIIDGDGRFAR